MDVLERGGILPVDAPEPPQREPVFETQEVPGLAPDQHAKSSSSSSSSDAEEKHEDHEGIVFAQPVDSDAMDMMSRGITIDPKDSAPGFSQTCPTDSSTSSLPSSSFGSSLQRASERSACLLTSDVLDHSQCPAVCQYKKFIEEEMQVVKGMGADAVKRMESDLREMARDATLTFIQEHPPQVAVPCDSVPAEISLSIQGLRNQVAQMQGQLAEVGERTNLTKGIQEKPTEADGQLTGEFAELIKSFSAWLEERRSQISKEITDQRVQVELGFERLRAESGVWIAKFEYDTEAKRKVIMEKLEEQLKNAENLCTRMKVETEELKNAERRRQLNYQQEIEERCNNLLRDLEDKAMACVSTTSTKCSLAEMEFQNKLEALKQPTEPSVRAGFYDSMVARVASVEQELTKITERAKGFTGVVESPGINSDALSDIMLQIKAIQDKQDELESQLARIGSEASPQPDSMSQIEARLKALEEKVEGISAPKDLKKSSSDDSHSDEDEAKQKEGGHLCERCASEILALRARVDELSGSLELLKNSGQPDEGVSTRASEGDNEQVSVLAEKVTELASGLASLQSQFEEYANEQRERLAASGSAGKIEWANCESRLSEELSTLRSRVDGISAVFETRASISESEQVSELSERVDALASQVSDLQISLVSEARDSVPVKRDDEGEIQASEIEKLATEVQALKETVDKKADAESSKAQIYAAIGELQSRIDDSRVEVENMLIPLKGLAEKAPLLEQITERAESIQGWCEELEKLKGQGEKLVGQLNSQAEMMKRIEMERAREFQKRREQLLNDLQSKI